MSEDIRIQPKDPETARAEIQRTRVRMSETIDEIEGVLLRKRARLKEQLDVGARIRENPLQAVGIIFGVGLVLGFLTGGGDDDEEVEVQIVREVDVEAEERAAMWEDRARRLLEIARVQEEEIEDLETVAAEYAALAPRATRWDDDDDSGVSRWSELRDTVTERVGGYVSKAAHALAEEWRKRV